MSAYVCMCICACAHVCVCVCVHVGPAMSPGPPLFQAGTALLHCAWLLHLTLWMNTSSFICFVYPCIGWSFGMFPLQLSEIIFLCAFVSQVLCRRISVLLVLYSGLHHCFSLAVLHKCCAVSSPWEPGRHCTHAAALSLVQLLSGCRLVSHCGFHLCFLCFLSFVCVL